MSRIASRTATTVALSPGRRERGKQDKYRRIFEAAADLFDQHGYSGVTTQQIADAADVGTGTLFRYFSSKAELLIVVMNDRLRVGAEGAIKLATDGATPTDAILGLLAPLSHASREHPENTAVYQRETLLGVGPHREAASRQVEQLEDAIYQILELCRPTFAATDDTLLREAAHAIHATMYMDIVRVTVGQAQASDLRNRLRRSVNFLVTGLLQPHS